MKRLFTFFFALFFIASFSSQSFAQDKAEIEYLVKQYKSGVKLSDSEMKLIEPLISAPNQNTVPNPPSNPKGALSEGFEDWPPSDWTIVQGPDSPTNDIIQSSEEAHTGTYSARFSSYSSASGYDEYLITPQLNVTSGDQTFSFWYKRYSYGSEVFRVGWSSTGTNVNTDFTWGPEISDASTTWQQYIKTDIPVGTKYIAIHYYSDYQYYLYVDDVAGPAVYTSSTQPDAPSNPNPADGATDVAISGTLTWDFGANTDSYDLWFGESGNMTKVVDNASTSGGSGSYSYTADYAKNYQWQVIAKNSSTGETTNGPVWSFSTPLLGPDMYRIGNGTYTGKHLPIEPYYGYTYSQSLYFATDFGSVGSNKRISKIYFNYSKSSSGNHDADDWVIYIGTTNSTEITDWIDVTTLTKVFDGNSGYGDITPGDGWMEITLDTPFNYDPSTDGNLIVAVDENTPGYTSSNDEFYCDQNTSKANVSIYKYSDSDNPDPSSPPAGTATAYFPNIIFRFEDIPSEPQFSVNPESYDYGTVYLGESSTEQTFTVTNTGLETLTISSAPTITGTNTGDFSITTDNNSYPVNLANGESATWGVTFTPQAEGTRSANLTFTDNTKATHDVPLSGTGYNATVTSYPYNESFTSFTVSDNATGFADDWRTSPSNTLSAFRWNPNKGTTPTPNTGPSADHTSGNQNGIYLFTEATEGIIADSAFVYSPPFDLNSLTNPAIEFYYHMYGSNIGTLKLDISTDNGNSWTNLFSKTGQQQTSLYEDWLPFYTELSAYVGKTVKFRFEAKRGNGVRGDIAIDDFYVGEKINKSLNSVTVTQAATSNALVGSTDNEILKIVFDVEGGSGTLPFNSIQVVGLNQNDADIATNGVKLYRTATATFGTDNLMASGSFAKGSVTFSGLNYDLQAGNNYFWVAYDISANATVGDTVDAKIPVNGIDVNGTTYNSEEDNPTGTRKLSGIALSSVTVTQASTTDIDLNGTLTDNKILRIFLNTELSTTSGGVSVDFTNLTVTTVNTNDNDVSAVKLYKTSTSTFGTDNLVATGTIGKGSVTFNLSESLTEDAYYWIAYDIANNATPDDTIDAKIPANGMTISGSTYNSTEDDPTGYRVLRQFNSGGGTAYGGYFWSNSTSNSGNNNPPVFSWIDPVAEGHTEITSWTSGSDDDGYFEVDNLPFTFTFFGKDYDTLYIGSNGVITFGSGYSSTGYSASIPSSSAPNNMIAGCLMDLDDGTDGKVYYGTSGGNFVVTWWHYHDYGDDNEYITFQIILKQNGNIKTQYKYSESALEMGITSSTILGDALVGIEDSAGTHGIQYRNNGIGGPIFDTNGKAGDLAVEYGQNENALPVELTNFTAIPNKDGEVEIKWETATEVNTAMFEVERSLVTDKPDEEQTWVTIGNVKASGTSNSPKEYGIKDELSRSGKYAYRLKIVDMDGNFEYSNIVEVTANIVLKYELSQNYPNPFNPTTTIKFSIKNSGKVKLAVYNALGQQVALLLNQEMEAGKYKVKFNASNLASGVYFYRIQSGKFTAVKKMLLLK